MCVPAAPKLTVSKGLVDELIDGLPWGNDQLYVDALVELVPSNTTFVPWQIVVDGVTVTLATVGKFIT